MGFVIVPDPALFVFNQKLPQPVNGEYATLEEAKIVVQHLFQTSPATARKIAEVKLYFSAAVQVTESTEAPPAPAPAGAAVDSFPAPTPV